MDFYKIQWKRSAVKELKNLPKETISKILYRRRKSVVKSASEADHKTGWLAAQL